MDWQVSSPAICTFIWRAPIGRVSHSASISQAWIAYQGVFNRDAVKRQRELKSELLSKKAELLQTSAQDQFAKWAKLRRSVDKGVGDLEKFSCVYATLHLLPVHASILLVPDSHVDSELNASKSSFSLKFNTALWIMTTGLQYAIGWWYSRSAVFYLPVAWLGPLTWWLSFPFAPAGKSRIGLRHCGFITHPVRLCQLWYLADGL
jgi:tail-anchored protein insertion receptor